MPSGLAGKVTRWTRVEVAKLMTSTAEAVLQVTNRNWPSRDMAALSGVVSVGMGVRKVRLEIEYTSTSLRLVLTR